MVNLFLTENSVNRHRDKQCGHQTDATESYNLSESVLFASTLQFLYNITHNNMDLDIT